MTGMDERNERLGRAIDRLPVPEHGPGFWEALRGQMERSERSVENEVVEVMPLPQRRSRQPLLLAAAAAAIIAVVGIGLAVRAGDGTNDEVDVATAVPTEEVPTEVVPTEVVPTEVVPTELPVTEEVTESPTEPPRPTLELGETAELGPGRVVAIGAGSEYAYVTDVDPEVAELGCEGSPWQSLYVHDVATGERTRVGEAGAVGATGLAEMAFGEGQVAILTSCEGFVDHLWVAGIVNEDAGVPQNLTEVPIDLAYVNDLQWVVGGNELLFAGATFLDDGTVERAGYRLDPATGELTDLGYGAVVWLAQGSDGEIVAVLESGAILRDGEPYGSAFDVSDVAVDADGAVWVSSFSQGVARLTDGGEATTVDGTPSRQLLAHPAGMLWVAVTDEEGNGTTLRAESGDLLTAYSLIVVMPIDGTSFGYTHYPTDDGAIRAQLVRFTPA